MSVILFETEHIKVKYFHIEKDNKNESFVQQSTQTVCGESRIQATPPICSILI